MSLYDELMSLPQKARLSILAECKEISDTELERRYNEMLDDIYPDLKIAGYDYQTSRALLSVDPTAWRCGFADYISSDETIIEIEGNYYTESEVQAKLDERDAE